MVDGQDVLLAFVGLISAGIGAVSAYAVAIKQINETQQDTRKQLEQASAIAQTELKEARRIAENDLAATRQNLLVELKEAHRINNRQLAEARSIAQAQLLLAFDSRLMEFDNVHASLRDNEAWDEEDEESKKLPDGIEWVQLDSYLGVFERMNKMVDDGLMQLDLVDAFYSYRLENIVTSNRIRQAKFSDAPDSDSREDWTGFISLCEKLEISIEKESDGE